MENTCNYSDNWQTYINDYDKFEYDIKTKKGTIILNCYPNNGWFRSEYGGLSVHESQVAEIVYAVTDELGRSRKEKKQKTYPKIRANWKAVVVKICDRIANMEQSKQYNEKLFSMYQNEYEDFCRNLMSSEHPHYETNKAWKRLGLLVEEVYA